MNFPTAPINSRIEIFLKSSSHLLTETINNKIEPSPNPDIIFEDAAMVITSNFILIIQHNTISSDKGAEYDYTKVFNLKDIDYYLTYKP